MSKKDERAAVNVILFIIAPFFFAPIVVPIGAAVGAILLPIVLPFIFLSWVISLFNGK